MPLSVDIFLQHVTPKRGHNTVEEESTSSLPRGPQSLGYYLVSKNSIGETISFNSAFGRSNKPKYGTHGNCFIFPLKTG